MCEERCPDCDELLTYDEQDNLYCPNCVYDFKEDDKDGDDD